MRHGYRIILDISQLFHFPESGWLTRTLMRTSLSLVCRTLGLFSFASETSIAYDISVLSTRDSSRTKAKVGVENVLEVLCRRGPQKKSKLSQHFCPQQISRRPSPYTQEFSTLIILLLALTFHSKCYETPKNFSYSHFHLKRCLLSEPLCDPSCPSVPLLAIHPLLIKSSPPRWIKSCSAYSWRNRRPP